MHVHAWMSDNAAVMIIFISTPHPLLVNNRLNYRVFVHLNFPSDNL